MSDKAAGWYPDPDGENRQRYWDGDSWTEYYTPLVTPSAELHGSTTATADYPYLVASTTGPHENLMAVPGTSGSGGWPTAPAQGGDGETQEFSGGGRRSRASMWAIVAASILVVMLVVGVGWWAFGPSTPPDDPTAGGDPSAPTDGETIASGMELDLPANATVPAGGLWVGSLTLAAETTLLVDARADASSDDLRITIVPEGEDDPVAGNDDRGNNLAQFGENALNPLAVATLPAGTYEVRIDERNGAESTFDVIATGVSTTITPGSAVDVSAEEGSYWAGALTVTESGGYTIDVRGKPRDGNSDPDPVLVLVGETDRQYINDDRDDDDYDPLLEQDLPAGTWVVLVFDWRLRAIDATVTATATS
ncbi:DUF2510 domain-containing protein [Pseudactinotalea sp.]|uniref:DUF2510 domain-containing protein n=1 Tax=Pseudactinotalea sp. TaxID=1926260 RepID=UPI003B3B3F82